MSTSELLTYFISEKQAGLLVAVLGVTSAALAAYLWFSGSLFRTMAWPLVIVGCIQIAVGSGLLIRTDSQVARLEEGLRSSSQPTVNSELARMVEVNRSFTVIKIVEIVLLLLGLALALAFTSRHPASASVGMGLLVEAAVMLVFDLFAEQRAAVYTKWLTELSQRL